MESPNNQFEIESASGHKISVSEFGEVDYLDTQQAMAEFATNRNSEQPDQIWLVQHPKVYTQGTACNQSTLLPSDIPVVKSDRGGQITYHGPGQIVMYPMLKLRRYDLGVKSLVNKLEQTVIDLLSEYQITGERQEGAPGIYVNEAKIAALGLRIRRGTCYHGLSLNVEMDLAPFANIDPCGFQGLQVVQLSDLVESIDLQQVKDRLLKQFINLI